MYTLAKNKSIGGAITTMKRDGGRQMGKKVKLGTTILVQSSKAIDDFKSRYSRDFKSPGEVVDMMADFCLNVNSSVAEELSGFCKERAEAAERELSELRGGAMTSLHSAEIKGRRDYFEALADHMGRFVLPATGEDDVSVMRRLDMFGEAYVVFPDAEDWIVVNEENAPQCGNVFVLEVRNSSKYNVPHFIYFSNADSCAIDEMADAVEPVWPKIREIQNMKVEPALDKNGKLLNQEEWAASPVMGVFKILDSTAYGRFHEAPYGMMVYRP